MQGGLKQEINKLIKNNKLLFSVLLIAILVLMAIKMVTPTSIINEQPEVNNSEVVTTLGKSTNSIWRDMEQELESELSKFLSNVKDCGKVQVMIRISKDETKIRAIDEDRTEKTIEEVDSTGVTRTTKEVRVVQKTVQENSSGGYKTVWLEMEAPEIEGVIVISTGAKKLEVKALLIEAISTYFNIPVYKISVMSGGN